ncbi:MAG: hypothetical protein AAGE76_15330 [Pseudomonadota bacterium]
MSAALLLATAPAMGQSFEPVIVVNEKAITQFEIVQRARFLNALGASGDALALAREQLINDRLREAVIERFEIEVTEEEIDQSVANFAGTRGLEVGELYAGLDGAGIAEETLRQFLAVQIGWRNFVQRRFAAARG